MYRPRHTLAVLSLLLAPALALADRPTTAPARTAAPSTRPTFTNPIGPGADPWIFRHGDHYYYTFTTGKTIILRKAKTLAGLADAPETLLYQAPPKGPNSDHLWAPELHRVGDRWYVYYCADDGPDANHRLFTLRSLDDNPEGPYEDTGPLKGLSDHWAIDATLLSLPPQPAPDKHDAPREGGPRLYVLWSGWINPPQPATPTTPDVPGGPQSIYIAPMSDPLTVSGPRVLLTKPTADWELHAWPVNEGPQPIHRDGKTHVVFSASLASTRHYCLALLTLTGNDPLNPAHWTKSPGPIFSEFLSEAGSVYGPGHCSFFKSPDGTEDWIAYHAKDGPEQRWRDRNTRAQPFTWTKDNVPVFGTPIPPGAALPVPSGEPTR